MARTAVGQITYFDVSDGLTGPQGPAGPATLSRYRTATNAATAGRPLTDNGLDGNWTDNPDLVDGQTGDTIFVSNQFANITQSGNPYQTTIAGTGTSGGTWVPARPEIATITVDADAMTSTRDPGVMETARFSISGNPGVGAVPPVGGVITISLSGLPTTITYDSSDGEGGAWSNLSGRINRTSAISGSSASSITVSNAIGSRNLEEYAQANSLQNGASVTTLDFVEFVLSAVTDLNVDYVVTRGTNSISLVGTQTVVDGDDFLWNTLSGFDQIDWIEFTGVNSSIDAVQYNVSLTATTARVRGGEVIPTIPFISGTGVQRTYTHSVVRFESVDNTSALQAQRFVDSIPTEITITNALASFGTSWSVDYSFSTFTSDEVEAIYDAIIQAGYQEDDEIVFTSDTGSGTYTIINITGFSISFRASPGSLNTGTPSDTMTFPHRIVGIEFTVTRDGSEVVITNTNVGNITGSYSFAITQNNSSTIAVSSPIITEGESADSPSELTIRTFTNTGTEVDTTIMFAGSLDATQIAAQIAAEWPAITPAGSNIASRSLPFRHTIDVDSLYFSAIGTDPDPVFTTWNTLFATATAGVVVGVADGSDLQTRLRQIQIDNSNQTEFQFEINDNNGNSVVFTTTNLIGINSNTLYIFGGTLTIVSQAGSPPTDGTNVDFIIRNVNPINPTGYLATANGRTVTLTGDTNSPRMDSSITNILSGTTGNLNAARLPLTVVDGVIFETEFTGTRSSVVFANGSQSISLDINPATVLSTEIQTEILDRLNFNDIDMYELPISGATFQLQSQSRALGADQTVDVTFNAGDSSDASIFKLNESAGQNQVTDAVINGWSFARTDSTIG